MPFMRHFVLFDNCFSVYCLPFFLIVLLSCRGFPYQKKNKRKWQNFHSKGSQQSLSMVELCNWCNHKLHQYIKPENQVAWGRSAAKKASELGLKVSYGYVYYVFQTVRSLPLIPFSSKFS